MPPAKGRARRREGQGPAGGAALRGAYGAADEAAWERARGWALLFALLLLEAGLAGTPRLAGPARRTLGHLGIV